jgi:hypothetical protein
MRASTTGILIFGLAVLILITAFYIVSQVSAESPTPWDTSWISPDAQARSRIIAAIDAILIDPQSGSVSGSSSGLRGKGAIILQYSLASIDGNPAGVNPAFALAMFLKEANFAKVGSIANTQNNPGNIRCTGVYGEVDCKNRFAVFASMDDGIKAYFWLLTREYKPGGNFSNNRKCTTIACVVQPYCPPSECDTDAYISFVTKWTDTFQTRLSNTARPDYDARTDTSLVPQFLLPTQNTTVLVKFTNIGSMPWSRTEVTFVNTNSQSLGANPRKPLVTDVAPGNIASFNLQITAPSQSGVYTSEWQLERSGQRFGPKVAIALTVAPQEVKTWWEQFETWVGDLLARITREIERAVQRALEDALRQMCAGSTGLLFLVAVSLVYFKGKSP